MKIGLYAYKTLEKTNTDAAEGIKQILEDEDICLDMLIGPEYTNIPLEEAKELSSIDSEVLLIPGTTLVQEGNQIFNRAFVLKDGQLLHQYDKIAGCASIGASDYEHYPHKRPKHVTFMGRGKKPLIFDYEGKQIGIEICRDHGIGFQEGEGLDKSVLKTALQNKPQLDIQILLSAGMAYITRNAVKSTGYAIHVDGGMEDERYQEIEPRGVVYGKEMEKPQDIKIITTGNLKEKNILYIYNIK